ncbi:tetratricopeptide repeat protein [Actinokineospora diospyrosa]|uniref:Tetratricopeptide repeat-containing protein n=1 Tax=Actinokineospora diospyrosa TaxID=103728 RepID=A0ABT1IIV5_9PSEU|nr:tetratricopeptide repeat protein [Actinokineospora diospyrosa]MCP2272576.1 Tetratricopeptide repeat-containing protein [Actinokineospora diospyrosa]
MGELNRLDVDVSGVAAQIHTVHGSVTIGGVARPVGGLPYRSGKVPVVVDGFQPRSVPELEGLVSGGVVLSGMGGVGKTQTAAEYASRASVDLVGWVTAASRTSLVSGLAELGAVVTESVIEDAEQGAQKFLDWCASTTRTWLLVFDDVSDPADVKGLWPNTGAHGRLVVTTRRNERWALQTATQRLVPLDVFTEAESAEYLRGVLGDVPGVEELAELLGHLPLALSQAAAYLAMTPGMTCLGYVDKWRTKRAALSEMFPEDWSGPGARIATTWTISIEAANRLPPTDLAGSMLGIMSVLAPTGIPLAVLTAAPVLTMLSTDADSAARALGCLRRVNLISVDSASIARVHALVQHATRDQLGRKLVIATAQVVASALLASWPAIERNTEYCALLRANTAALAANCEDHLWPFPSRQVLFRAATSLGDAGQAHAAAVRYRDLHAKALRLLGPDHHHTLVCLANLGFWHTHIEDFDQAIEAYTTVVTASLRTLGPDHRETFAARGNLANCHGRAGRADLAAAAFADLAAESIRVLGPDHPDTLTTRGHLARWRGAAGDPSGAVTAARELLADAQRVLGPDHHETLSTRYVLAYWLGKTGHSAEALAMYADLNDDRTRVLGPDHPQTLEARATLLAWRAATGDGANAIQDLPDLVADLDRVLGPDHPNTVMNRRVLETWREHNEPGDS